MNDYAADVLLRPNPVKSVLSIDYFTEKTTMVQVLITNSKGAVVVRCGFQALTGKNTFPVNASLLSGGIYSLQLISNTGTITKRMIKE